MEPARPSMLSYIMEEVDSQCSETPKNEQTNSKASMASGSINKKKTQTIEMSDSSALADSEDEEA